MARTTFPARQSNGAVAQLGERLNGIQEVRGSIPLGSTKYRLTNAFRFFIKESLEAADNLAGPAALGHAFITGESTRC